MSLYRINVVACHPQHEERISPAIEVLVDTGAELTWLPAELLEKIGIKPRRKRTFQTATKQLIEREVGYAILRAEGFETTDEVVFAQLTDLSPLGVRTLEGFGVMVDSIAHRLVATTTLVAAVRPLPLHATAAPTSRECLKSTVPPVHVRTPITFDA